ncbi:transcription antitermination factor NusB [Salisediminibacterium halotolerans]|uniref:transcription antitermination factor NusB n=1 Tax=Salisediminibacterium halotolerans TaxID=517425 RepID=UPI000EAD49F3|nr:transcription antitermination factor NusB [Salisediminibacterium halotolerans]RLJ78076.1 NusB antitermination factor [Actinophytocola xinjiangensis]RPE88586.1 NusB antitermination factor [Salisediminibacterium halotolerans]TWG37053.1 NusB antitermination factor [Salisediminibacterium halotolerans]GEL06907.1 N utilization substance protein B [Salisediminibacterium halotolerans]
MNRRHARIKAVQALYQIEMTGADINDALNFVLEEDEVSDPFLETLITGTLDHLAEIDPLIENSMDHWALSRLSKVDHAVMRMALYEMIKLDDVPVSVSINEAIELARGFSGDPESGKFVNGVLSHAAESF